MCADPRTDLCWSSVQEGISAPSYPLTIYLLKQEPCLPWYLAESQAINLSAELWLTETGLRKKYMAEWAAVIDVCVCVCAHEREWERGQTLKNVKDLPTLIEIIIRT